MMGLSKRIPVWRGIGRPLIIIIFTTAMVLTLWYMSYPNQSIDDQKKQVEEAIHLPKVTEEPFQGYGNETGADHFIVPNIIHFVRFNKTEYSFVDYICLKAAFRNHRPDYFYIHTDVGDQYHGKYWEWIMNDPELKARIVLIHLDLPSEVFGQKLSDGWRFHHGSDVARIRIMMKYGGIYLDNDVYVIKNLDKYRKFEISMNWDENQFLGNQVFIAHKDARFLKLYLETYRDNYHSDRWYYNAGERPTVEILYQHPELLHRVKGQFGADTGVSMRLYHREDNWSWRTLDTIHLLMNHRSYMDPGYKEYPVFDENNIRNYPHQFGEMAREILDS